MTKKLVKMIIGSVFLLGAGVITGTLIGISIGEQRAYKKMEERKKQETAITEKPEVSVTPDGTLTPTAAVKTPEAVVTPEPPQELPAKSAEPTGKATVTVTPLLTGAAAIATAKPTVAPSATPTGIPVVSDRKGYYGRLHIENTYLADEKNTLVQLRGISTHGIGWFPQYVNEAAIRQFHEEWGCSVIRLAMYTAGGAGYCTGDAARKEKLKGIICDGIEAAIRQNMYVLVDWHVLQDQNPNLYKEDAKAFFAEIAGKYGDDPHILYEICNEPNGGTSWSQIKSYALEVISVIREYAPNAVVIVGTPTWSQDVDVAAKDPITEYDNIMYALHFYAETHREDLRNKCKTAVEKGLPIFVTEYGICDASGNGAINRTQAELWMELLDGYGISHVAWNLSNKNESSSMLAAGCSKVDGFTESDLSAGGRWFVDMLKEAGAGIGAALSGTTEAGQETGTESVDTSGEQSLEGSPKTEYVTRLNEILIPEEGLSMNVSNSWSSGDMMGAQLSLTVKNDTGEAVSDWERRLTVKEGVTVEVEQSWNAVVSRKENTILIKPAEYNKTIPAGGSVGDIGLILNITE